MEVVDWKNKGAALTVFKKAGGSVIIAGRDKYFRPGIDWNLNTFGRLSLRYSPPGAIVGNGGPMCFPDEKVLLYLLGFLNSSAAALMTGIINPSRNCPPGTLGSLPFDSDHKDQDKTERVSLFTEECIQISKTDWNSFETSSDFKKHPLI